MMHNEHDHFEAFLKGTMPQEDRRAFEARLREDPAFAGELQSFRSLVDVVGIAGDARLKERLAAIHDELHADSAPSGSARVIPMFPRSWIALAASVALMIAGSWYFFGRTTSPQELFAENMSPYAAPDRTRSGETGTNDRWARFISLYSLTDYDQALEELKSVAPERAPRYLVDFYRGQCLLLKKDPDPRAAIIALQQVLENDNDVHEIAHWYMGLAALKANDPALARAQFAILKNAGGYKSAEAAAILRALGEP